MTTIPGYTFGSDAVPASPIGPDGLAQIHASLLWGDGDRDALRRAAPVIVPQIEAILDVWYGFVGSNPHLVETFAGADGHPDTDYLGAVRERFGQWIVDVCTRDFDSEWLAYQHEIARRHAPAAKNRTDTVDSTSQHVPLGQLVALIVPITLTMRSFLAADDPAPAELEARHQAWFKAVTMSVALWSHPYAPGLW